MRIDEVTGSLSNSEIPAKLFNLAEFLSGRAEDTGSQKQISMKAFLELAHSQQINITPDTLVELSTQQPLNGIIMPIEPNATVINFVGSEPESVAMPVNKAQDIVAAAAKSAAKKDRGI